MANIRSLANLRTEIVRLQELGANVFFNAGVDVDEKQTTQYAVQLYQGGLTLPNREFYFKTDARTEKVKAAYRAYLTQVFELLGAAPTVAPVMPPTTAPVESASPPKAITSSTA